MDRTSREAELTDDPRGRLQKTGRTLVDGVATIRIDDTQADNERVVIHVEHHGHDGGVRAFFRHRDGDVGAAIRSHLRTETSSEIARVEIIDTVGVGISETEVLPRRYRSVRCSVADESAGTPRGEA